MMEDEAVAAMRALWNTPIGVDELQSAVAILLGMVPPAVVEEWNRLEARHEWWKEPW